MPAVTRVGDHDSGSGEYSLAPLAQGSPSVFVNGIPVGRVGDVYESHGGHADVIAEGSAHVFADGIPVARVGDAVDCDGGTATVAEGSGNVFAGDGGGDDDASRNACAAKRDVIRARPGLSDADALILCLPDIADAEAMRASNVADCQGWTYLSEMLCKWISGPASTDVDAQDPFYVDMDWVLSYDRGRVALENLKQKVTNDAAMSELAKMAMEELGSGDYAEFDFIDVDRPGERYFQYEPAGSVLAGYLFPDGMDASLGRFTLRAIAKGSIQRTGTGVFKVSVEKTAAVLWDSFDFEGDQPLGAWDCEGESYSAFGVSGYLENSDFRNFRMRNSCGRDFRVVSKIVNLGCSYIYGYPF